LREPRHSSGGGDPRIAASPTRRPRRTATPTTGSESSTPRRGWISDVEAYVAARLADRADCLGARAAKGEYDWQVLTWHQGERNAQKALAACKNPTARLVEVGGDITLA
jgi:hypothetical protein